MFIASTLIALAVCAGHVCLWILVWNQNEGSGHNAPGVRYVSWLIRLATPGLPIVYVLAGGLELIDSVVAGTWRGEYFGPMIYTAVCLWVLLVFIPRAVVRRWRLGVPQSLKMRNSSTIRVHDTSDDVRHAPATRQLIHFPGNESMEFEASELTLEYDDAPAELNGFTIAHLTDLHLTGRVPKVFFEQAIEQVNRWEPDLIAVTGDLVDAEAYVSWLPSLLGRLRARHGIYFVLGNHDLKVDTHRLKIVLAESGLHYVGSGTHQIKFGDAELLIAGDERPWSGHAPNVDSHPRHDKQFRLMLAHAPDVAPDARDADFDLMLAGHTHGGQVQLPLVGPLVCPSTTPLEYVSGTTQHDQMTLHVSRGLSAEWPVRWNCKPEITKLVLHTHVRVPTLQTPAIHIEEPTYFANDRSNEKKVAHNYRAE